MSRATAGAGSMLRELRERRREWTPWLAVIETVVNETDAPAWEAAVPALGDTAQPEGSMPLLNGARVSLDADRVSHFLARLVRVNARQDTPKMAALPSVLDPAVNICELFEASLCRNDAHVGAVAAKVGVDPDALHALVNLLPVPFLHACRRRWASLVPPDWLEGFCPVCGGWPAFAEVRGIERTRYLRCGRCGGEWPAHMLRCSYCGTTTHDDFVALVPADSHSPSSIEACKRCFGYVKAFTRLQACEPAAVMLEDLASVELDISAIEQGFARPAAPPGSLQVSVGAQPARRRFFVTRT